MCKTKRKKDWSSGNGDQAGPRNLGEEKAMWDKDKGLQSFTLPLRLFKV
jgi:hypothetical protein